MSENCFICGRAALLGFHPACILKTAREIPTSAPSTETVCRHCPFRSDKPNWMDKGRIWLNRLRYKYRHSQFCHMAGFKHLVCRGMIDLANGGIPGLIMTPDELHNLTPCDDPTSAYERG